MEKPILLTFGFPDTNSPRYHNLVDLYESEGFDVQQCHTAKNGFIGKIRELIENWKLEIENCDCLLVVFPGHHLMPLAWLLTRFPRKQLIFDAFVSVSDTLVSDRKKYSWINPYAWFLYLVDFVSCHLADEVLIDTEAHKAFFASRFFLKKDRIRVVYVGTRKDLFTPGPSEGKLEKDKYNVLFIGSYIPLQGIEYILKAAKTLEDKQDIHFTLIGSGQTYEENRALAETLQLRNVSFVPFLPIEELPSYIRSADVALGTFGTSDKANRIIAHKVYDAVACGIPVITAKNDAIEEKFTDGKEVYLCKAGDAQSLADAICRLKG